MHASRKQRALAHRTPLLPPPPLFVRACRRLLPLAAPTSLLNTPCDIYDTHSPKICLFCGHREAHSLAFLRGKGSLSLRRLCRRHNTKKWPTLPCRPMHHPALLPSLTRIGMRGADADARPALAAAARQAAAAAAAAADGLLHGCNPKFVCRPCALSPRDQGCVQGGGRMWGL